MKLSDGEILELMKLSTRLTLHYESVLAREDGAVRTYALDAGELQKDLARVAELLAKEGRKIEHDYGDFAFIDSRMISSVLAETLDIVSVRYSLEPLLDSQMAAAALRKLPPRE